ncbi:MAG: glycosyltransferase [Thermoproteota archaeon]
MKTSVIICTYNYARFLLQCLESVLNQTRLPDEVIVVDDGSTDETPQVVRRYRGVRYIWQEHGGKAAAFNRGFEASIGDIICHLDADAFWLPNKMERVVRALHSFPGVGGLIHEVIYVDANGKTIGDLPPSRERPPLVCSLEEFLLASFNYLTYHRHYRFFGANTVCVRREVVEDLFPLPPEIGFAVDGLLLLAAARLALLV